MELPLFPLNTVLFPGATIPLHIFEERYKKMVRLCLDEQRPFGVLLIKKGSEVGETAELFEVGTTAHITGAQHLAEGRMNLVCLGGQRFRVLSRTSDYPYLVGEVEVLVSVSESDRETRELVEVASTLFAEHVRLYLALSNQWASSVEMPADADRLADYIGSRLAVDFGTKQRLLEELSAHNRLAQEIELMGDAIREMTPRAEGARAQRWRGFAAMN